MHGSTYLFASLVLGATMACGGMPEEGSTEVPQEAAETAALETTSSLGCQQWYYSEGSNGMKPGITKEISDVVATGKCPGSVESWVYYDLQRYIYTPVGPVVLDTSTVKGGYMKYKVVWETYQDPRSKLLNRVDIGYLYVKLRIPTVCKGGIDVVQPIDLQIAPPPFAPFRMTDGFGGALRVCWNENGAWVTNFNPIARQSMFFDPTGQPIWEMQYPAGNGDTARYRWRQGFTPTVGFIQYAGDNGWTVRPKEVSAEVTANLAVVFATGKSCVDVRLYHDTALRETERHCYPE